ncbi:hypothetical protein K461DRAFT_319113 [Myriangium duriaei CBS 260.36]|uniref:Zn(2)-C6 fungal-type domain-containing protein n=1 Tax=Myriangium duriaei CBS 260.36 TaxID=1168546 RepID=A0A9P4MPC9_9PEZI|nr:hypothetical protein K461DRAFT_319113 [Myriangium duriaei CBS 260.36]
MGRKPNALILEFFQRGAKLEDQSNRYEHTCKMCGMVFPKGRPDSMNRHLFEKCPNISDYDKARAFAYAQGQMDVQRFANRAHGQNDNMHIPFAQHGGPIQLDQGVSGPNATLNREPSALDTLAEVSRQHLDLSRQRFQGDASGMVPHDPALDTGEMETWMMQLQQQLAEANDAEDARTQRNIQQSIETSPLIETASAASQLNASLEGHPIPHVKTRTGSLSSMMPSSQLAQHTNLDPALHTQLIDHAEPVPQSQAASLANTSNASHLNLQALYDYNNNNNSGETLQAPDIRGFGLLQRPGKKQRRNKFSAERRKEVGGIRKMGACLRCRMLKKPCSGETPCATCSVIGAPRVWRAACIRTRVADEFTLYNTSYFYAKARDTANVLLGSTQMEKSGGNIAVTFFNDGLPLALPALQNCSPSSNAAGSDTPDSSTVHDMTRTFALQLDTQEAAKTVESYLDLEHERFVAAEPNTLLRATLQTLKQLDNEHKDTLVARTIFLWSATTLLVAPETLTWEIVHKSSESTPGGVTTSIDAARPDHALLQSQVLDAVERYASQAVKQVCNELERRLLARATSTSMITFLITVLLLNSVERMSLLFRTFDTRASASTTSPPADPSIASPGAPQDWPLTRPPSAYFSQGFSFSNLLHLLLRMRSLPPRTVLQHATPLAEEQLVVVKVEGSHVTQFFPEEEDAQERTYRDDEHRYLVQMATWLSKTGVTMGDLLAQAVKNDDDVVADGAGAGKAWDLRFVAGLVLPDHWEDKVAGEALHGHGDARQAQGLEVSQRNAVQGRTEDVAVVDPALAVS